MSKQIQMKTCSHCKKTKPCSEFPPNRSRKDGYNHSCRACSREANTKYRVSYKEKLRKSASDWYYANIDRAKQSRNKYRRSEHGKLTRRIKARNRYALKKHNGGLFTKLEWISLCNKYENKCLACGSSDKLTIDHIVPITLGGINSIENIQPLCMSCNHKKGVKSIDYRP
jgi:5-methylcytosine-specific restriction endonuclease McrA